MLPPFFEAAATVLLGGSLIGHVISAFIIRSQRRKIKAEETLTTVQAAAEVVGLYGKALKTLEAKVESLEEEVRCLKDQNHELQIEVRELRSENRLLRASIPSGSEES